MAGGGSGGGCVPYWDWMGYPPPPPEKGQQSKYLLHGMRTPLSCVWQLLIRFYYVCTRYLDVFEDSRLRFFDNDSGRLFSLYRDNA